MNMVSRRQFLKATVLAAGLAVGGQAYAGENWDMLVYLPLESKVYAPLIKFVEDVRTQTKGEVVITMRSPGELPYAPADYHRAVGSGEAQMADTAYFSSDITAAGALTLPLLLKDEDEMAKVVDVIKPDIEFALAGFGDELLAWSTYAPTLLWGTGTPLTSVDGLKGLKTRTLNPEVTGILTALGAIPVTLASPEVMSAVQYGTVDAILTANYGLTFAKWVNSFEWGYNVQFSMTPTFLIANKQAMERLSPENQKIIRDLALEYQNMLPVYMKGLEKEARKEIKAAGLTVAEVTPEDRKKLEAAASVIWDEWAQRRGGDAPEILKKVRAVVNR